jgi:hypothetical protein
VILKKRWFLSKKSYDLTKRNKSELAADELNRFFKYFDLPTQNLEKALLVIIFSLLGQSFAPDIAQIKNEISKANQLNPTEFHRFRTDYLDQWYSDNLARFIETLHDYIQCYEGLVQTLIYARRGVNIEGNYSVSNKDWKKIKMFYGNCYEDLTASYFVPACINNISGGRNYDQFKNMDLKKYLTINKMNRTNPFQGNSGFSCLYSELDSTIRNASHHGAIRLSEHKAGEIEYRSGDTGGWKKMTYAKYSYKCNSILLCYVKTIFIHMTLKLLM